MTEWRAAVTEDWAALGVRVHLGRWTPDGIDVVTGFDADGRPTFDTMPHHTAGTHPGLFLDREAARALAEALKPGPSAAELKRLEDSLDVERRRVDDVLDRLTPAINASDVVARR